MYVKVLLAVIAFADILGIGLGIYGYISAKRKWVK